MIILRNNHLFIFLFYFLYVTISLQIKIRGLIMLIKKYKIGAIFIYILVIGVYTILATSNLSAAHHQKNEETSIKKEAPSFKNQWQGTGQLKVVNRFSTFLFKTPEAHPIKDKLLLQAKTHTIYQLTQSENQQLLAEQLVDSELLYNDVVKILDIQGDYAKVVALQQPNGPNNLGYEGWVFITDLSDIPQTYTKAQHQIVITVPQVTTKYGVLSLGSYLPVIKENDQNYEVATLSGHIIISKHDARDTTQPLTMSEMLQVGRQLIGTDYVWSGISSQGFDCSGLVYTLYRLMNIEIPRDTTPQTEAGQSIDNYDDAQPGDILLFTNEQGITHHVGIYLGDDEMLHAPNIDAPVEIINIKDTVYEQELSHIRRMVQN